MTDDLTDAEREELHRLAQERGDVGKIARTWLELEGGKAEVAEGD